MNDFTLPDWGTIMFESRAEYNELEVPRPQNRQSSDSAADSVDADRSLDLAAAYLLQQVQNGHAYLRIATSLLARRAPDFGLAFANIEASRRTLDVVGRYLSNVELECNAARGVVSARKQLSKQHRETLRRFRKLCQWHRQRSSAIWEHPAFV
jgi:hypothetical protein